MTDMKASDLFVKALENEGVEYIFGIPGEETLDLLESLSKSSIKFIVTRHEQSAGFMAATYGRLTGKTGVALSTLGPGATNLMTAVAYAQLGGMPALFITGQKPLNYDKQAHFQIIDVVNMMKPIVKSAKQIVHPQSIPVAIREAFRIAEEERPGAVHLELPEDVAGEKMDDLSPMDLHPIRRPIAEEKAISQAVEMISKAKRPVIVIGAGSNRKRISSMLTEFINEVDIPFISTQMGKGVVDERHSRFLGTAALSADDYVHCAIDQADLIITIGHDVKEKPPFIMSKEDKRKVIDINFSPAMIDSVYFPHHSVVGDIANAIWQIKEQLIKKRYKNTTFFETQKSKIEKNTELSTNDDRFPVIPQKIVSDIRDIMPDDGILSLDNGMFKLWFARNYPAYQPNTLLLDNALATMGAGLPSAIVTKLIYPERTVMAVCGDGGFMMNSQELETAVRLKLDLVIVIINDNSYGMIKWKQDIKNFKEFGLSYGNPDFVKYAESYGANGYKIENTNELSPLLDKLVKSKGVHVVEIPVDYSENIRVFTRELNEKTC